MIALQLAIFIEEVIGAIVGSVSTHIVFAVGTNDAHAHTWTTPIVIPLHWVVFHPFQFWVYAVVSPGPVPYKAQIMFSSVGEPARNVEFMKLLLSHQVSQFIFVCNVVLPSKCVAK